MAVEIALGLLRSVDTRDPGPAPGILGFDPPVLIKRKPERSARFAASVEEEIVLVMDRAIAANGRVNPAIVSLFGRLESLLGVCRSGEQGKEADP